MEENVVEISNSEKLKRTLDFFKELGLDPPTEVKNAVQDVFDENVEINNVDFFFKDGVIDLEEELTLTNEVNINLNGKSYGQSNKVYSYYGALNISLSEFVRLYDGEELIDEITNIDNRDRPTKLENSDDYIVNLVQTTEFEKERDGEGSYEEKYILRIYCPVNSEEE